MEEKLDLELFEKHKETLKPYLQSVISKGVVCVAPHLKHVRDKDPVAVLCAELMERFCLSLREMCYLFVTKDLKDLHIYCEVCGHRRPKLIDDKKYCSTKCMYKSEDYQQTVKAARAAQRKEFDEFKKSLVAGLVKETKDFSFSEAKARIDELRAYMSTLAKADGCVNISPHRKALIDKNPIAIFVEQMMYRYDLTLEEVNFLVKCDFTKSLFCKTCGSRLKEISLDHCSTSCARRDPEVQAKYEATSRQNYGVSNPAQSKVVQDKISQTNMEKYGVAHTFQVEEVKDKIRQTWEENYHESNPNKSPIVRQKILRTVKANKYQFFLEFLETLRLELLDSYEDYINNDLLNIRCKDCNTEYQTTFSVSNQLIDRCPNCTKPYSSYAEGEILSFVKELLGDSTEICTRDRNAIYPYELDIYIPEHHLAIEYDGSYWHSTNFRNIDPNYHKLKTDMCEEKGIRLIHIFEYEWAKNTTIIKSVIRSALGKNERIIYARNCDIHLIDDATYKDFLILNHLQGYVPSKIRLGLFYEDELVACIGIGKSRFKDDEIELLRFGVKQNTSVVGALSKLIKHSRVKELVSYVNRRYFDGKGYTKAGFEYLWKSKPAYRYVRGEEIVTRLGSQKHKLPELLGDKFNPDRTEEENMTLAGYCKLYDSGMLKFKYICNEESVESK